jgi:glycosyltransferase involved in cell wall biosynthesis
MVDGLLRRGWQVDVHELAGSFPDADTIARSAMEEALTTMAVGSPVLIDGLAGGGLPEPLGAHTGRLRMVALVHHPLADETGLSGADQRRFEASERASLGACRGVIVSSAFVAGRLATYGVEPGRMRVVPPGTAPARPATGPGGDHPPMLLCVGTVTPRKGHDVLVAALERVGDLPWRCVCVGSLRRTPDHARAVRDLVVASGLQDRIVLAGEVDSAALDELYHGASIFVLASHYEGFGMVLTEALARGLPIVSSTGGAIPHTVPDGAGMLVPPGDTAALADAIRVLLTDPQRRGAIAATALAHAATLPDWGEAEAAFETAVLDLVQWESRRPGRPYPDRVR